MKIFQMYTKMLKNRSCKYDKSRVRSCFINICIFIQSYIAKNSLRAPENITAQL